MATSPDSQHGWTLVGWSPGGKSARRILAREVVAPDGTVQGVLVRTEILDAERKKVLSSKTLLQEGLTLTEVRDQMKPVPLPVLAACPGVDRKLEDPPHREVYRFLIQDQDETYPKWGWKRRGEEAHRKSHLKESEARKEAWNDYDFECTPALHAERAEIAKALLAEISLLEEEAKRGKEAGFLAQVEVLAGIVVRVGALKVVLETFLSDASQS